MRSYFQIYRKLRKYIHQAQMKTDTADTGVANFVQKAFDIISNTQYSKIIQWSTNGKEFTIKDIQQFEQTILPRYFRHKNINSFIRQLNMYGFHKSRKEPTKNIFSHPYFLKDQQQLLCQVRRKIKQDENETPRKFPPHPQESQDKISVHEKPTAQKEDVAPKSMTSLAYKSVLCFEKQNLSPFKGLISKSVLMDINPENCLVHRENMVDIVGDDEDDELVSIADEINQRKKSSNRIIGISIIKTLNFMEDFDF